MAASESHDALPWRFSPPPDFSPTLVGGSLSLRDHCWIFVRWPSRPRQKATLLSSFSCPFTILLYLLFRCFRRPASYVFRNCQSAATHCKHNWLQRTVITLKTDRFRRLLRVKESAAPGNLE